MKKDAKIREICKYFEEFYNYCFALNQKNMIHELKNYSYGSSKRKTSKSKKGMRRSHHKILKKNIVEDKKSGEYKLSHHVDLKTGFYNGKKILDL